MKVGANPEIDVMIAAKILAHEVNRNQAGHIVLEFGDAALDSDGKPIDIRVTVEVIDHDTPQPNSGDKRGAAKANA